MDRVRGGVFSGAMVLAGISATLLSALLAIGIRQVTSLHQAQPVQVTMVPSSGEVAVPDATASPQSSPSADAPTAVPAYAPVPHSYVPPATSFRTTAGSRSAGGSVTVSKPVPTATSSKAPAPAPSATPTPTPTSTRPGNGQANGAGNGNGNGHHH